LLRQAGTGWAKEGHGARHHLLPLDYRCVHGSGRTLFLLLLGIVIAEPGEQSVAESGRGGALPGIWAEPAWALRDRVAGLPAQRLRTRGDEGWVDRRGLHGAHLDDHLVHLHLSGCRRIAGDGGRGRFLVPDYRAGDVRHGAVLAVPALGTL